MKLRSASWPLLCVVLVTLGCAKGDTGPTGPTGPRGATGSANVIYSEWYSPDTWYLETEFGTTQRFYSIGSTSITQEIIDQGVVMVYMRFVGFAPEIVQLPFLVTDAGYQFYYCAQADSVKVAYYVAAARATTPSIIPSYNQVRYVLISGGVVAATMQAEGSTYEQEVASLRYMPYADVCRKYGVPE
jgi:hypothetical protein